MRLEFSELLDPATVDRETVQVLIKDISGWVNQEVRYILRNGVIGVDGKPKGVLILDPTVSAFEAEVLQIPENGVGFSASSDQVEPNLLIRIPTAPDPVFGINQVLTNLQGTSTLVPQTSDPLEYSERYDPIVVRALRTGNNADPSNGFLLDLDRPSLVADFDASILTVGGSGTVRTFTYQLEADFCSGIEPEVGDVFIANDSLLVVSSVDSLGSDPNYIHGVTAALLEGDLPVGGPPISASLTARYTPRAGLNIHDENHQLCWVRFFPEPEFLPAQGVDPASSISIQFSEPVDSSRIRSMETMVLHSFDPDYDASDPDGDPSRPFQGMVNSAADFETVETFLARLVGYEYIGSNPFGTGSGRIQFGPVTPSVDSRSFAVAPSSLICDTHGEPLGPFLALALLPANNSTSNQGIVDLAGNPADFFDFVAGSHEEANPASALEEYQYITLTGTVPTERYFALRCNSTDENGDGLAEYGGQFYFPDPGIMYGRPVNHFSRVVDPASNPYVAQRIAFGQGIMTPLTPAGAVLMQSYGYHHLGLGLLNENEFNLDVEGMSWSPFNGLIYDDTFSRFSLGLAHSERFPDDHIDPNSGYPAWKNSGLKFNSDFDRNVLGWAEGYVETVVFDTTLLLSQNSVYTSTSGSSMYPWPEFDSTYTWRDTDIPPTIMGAPNGRGVPPQVTGQPVVFGVGQAPSIALPLLQRYRCYPMGEEFGLNGFQIQIMVGSSAKPAFRVFSAGGQDSGGNWHQVIPDVPPGGTRATGGYNTTTGETTKAFGPELYWGQVDFVTRISRVYTHWFEFGGTLASISPVTIEPDPLEQAAGTEILVEFRATDTVTESTTGACQDAGTPLTDATQFDGYSNYEGSCGSVSSPTDWSADLSSFYGKQFFQIRFTFVQNITQDLEAEMDAFGFAWNVD